MATKSNQQSGGRAGAESVRLVTADEAARLLSCSLRQVWRLIRSGRLRRISLGRRCARIAMADIDRLAEEARRPGC